MNAWFNTHSSTTISYFRKKPILENVHCSSGAERACFDSGSQKQKIKSLAGSADGKHNTECLSEKKGFAMYKIEKTELGFHLTFGGSITKVELERWYEESKGALRTIPIPFGVIIDMRTLNPLPEDAQSVMVRGQAMYRKSGMLRSCVILKDAITVIQFRRLAKKSGIYAHERYLDVATYPDWEQHAIDWVVRAIDPTKRRAAHSAGV